MGKAGHLVDAQITDALKSAIVTGLGGLRTLVPQCTEPFLVWTRGEGGGWHGQYTERVTWNAIRRAAASRIAELGNHFTQLFRQHHPEYAGLVGFHGMGLNILHDRGYILGAALAELWNRHGTLDCSNDQIAAVVQEFADFVDHPTVRFRYVAPLLNLHMHAAAISLPGEMRMRHLSDAEATQVYGGPLWMPRLGRNLPHGPCDCLLEGEFEETKLLGDEAGAGSGNLDTQVRPAVERAILALRTFKDGSTGYDQIHAEPVAFCPVGGVAVGHAGIFVPVGSYHISEAETGPLQEHARRVMAPLRPSMEMACSRLADAQTRIRPEDRLVDAVVGLEAILLAALGSDDRRGELKFRFALHYSTLHPTVEERLSAFRKAKDLYDIRSRIAHGSTTDKREHRVGDRRMSLAEAAKEACQMLRGTINHFLENTLGDAYARSGYWEARYFGLAEQ